MDKVTQESSYKEIVTITLSGYQLIEARIKTYFHDYFEIVKYRIGNDLHFGFEGQDYSNAALGTLLKVFSKTCADSELLKDLRAEITHRDHVAHQWGQVLRCASFPFLAHCIQSEKRPTTGTKSPLCPPVGSSLAVCVISVFSSLHPIREKTNYWHQIPIVPTSGVKSCGVRHFRF
ncbi:hypothetical protein EMM73_17385 [Rheinheimera sediminis]|uniref:hypothetical protein n=1 Tax=Rheinheimera sp. YQF-1 TaxID=2499626 RepID=UPI000FD7ACEA|nr:hypothetical protein [Rheinheimera sp. YQF-1]RVT44130.1 hypothetical protein EMM73_17385 [Rheinheimera sp. YQF-1]